jgi:hypothetical protein
MTTKRFAIINFVLLGFFILDGCVSGNQAASSLVPPTLSPVSPISSPISPTPSPNPTPTLTDTPTPISVPTLSADAAYARLRELLNDSNCRLPCWMGIIPGQSTLQDVYEQLIMFSGIIPSFHGLYIEPAGKWSSGDLTITQPNDNMAIEIGLYYLTPPNMSHISVIAPDALSYRLKNGERDVDIYDYPPLNELIKAYTLTSVLSGYGLPNRIFIYTLATSPLVYFQIHVWYPEKGIFMIYKLLAHDRGDGYQLCPAQALISGYLTQPSVTDYQGFLLQMDEDTYKNFFPPTAFVKTTDEAFGMTSNQFYQLFRSPSTECLETSKAIWPVVTGP